ncbi:Uncharacterised protein [Klebsiella pneumoniae]|uniref:Uncharacterized protein n=1 Tax=Klebsiella pneumoniae TaxID=573 RepID=A0A377XMX1_KLEPN|nr:Uncharacterised protein [Klebsiella pneumoniae]
MAANIVSPAQSGRFYYGCAGAAGLLAGLAFVFWFPALASWWPSDLVRVYHAMPYVMRFGGGECRGYSAGGLRHPNAVGFVLAFCHPGHSKLPIVAWAVHNQPSPREMVDWILRSWVLQFGFLVIIFWRFAFMGKLSSDRLMQIVGILTTYAIWPRWCWLEYCCATAGATFRALPHRQAIFAFR